MQKSFLLGLMVMFLTGCAADTVRWDSSIQEFEGWDGSSWRSLADTNKTYTVFLGGSTFGHNSVKDGFFRNAISGFGGASFTPRSAWGDGYNSIQIPLDFPKGTVLKDIEISFYDNDVNHNIEFKLYSLGFTHGFTHYAVGNYVSSGSSTSIQTEPFLSGPFLLEFDSSYWIEVRAIADSSNPNTPTWGNGTVNVRMARVKYTLP